MKTLYLTSGMRTLLSIFLFLSTSFQVLLGQNTHTYWLDSEADEYVKCAEPYAPDRIFSNVMIGNYSTSYPELFTQYKNKMFIFDYELNVLANQQLDQLDGYEIMIYGVLDKQNNEPVVWGRAMNIDGGDNQLVIIHFSSQLEIQSYAFYGDESTQEYFMSAFKDDNGDYVFAASNSLQSLEGNVILTKVNPAGEQIQYTLMDNMESYKTKIINAPGDYYYLLNVFNLYKLDTDFNIMDSYDYPDTLSVNPDIDIEIAEDNKLVVPGTYMSPPVPGSPTVIDMGYIEFTSDYQPVYEQTMGAYDTVDFGRFISVSGWDTLYLAGDKNLQNNPPDDSWVSIYRIRNQEIEQQWNIGGQGQYTPGSLESLENGGFIAGINDWDFYTYPGEQKQRDVLLYTENYGDTAVGVFPAAVPEEIIVYPQPADRQLFIKNTSPGLRFSLRDMQGKLCYRTKTDAQNRVHLPPLAPGIYYYRLEDRHTTVKSGKLLVH